MMPDPRVGRCRYCRYLRWDGNKQRNACSRDDISSLLEHCPNWEREAGIDDDYLEQPMKRKKA